MINTTGSGGFGGSSTPPSSLYQRNKVRGDFQKKKDVLEAAIEKAKGTPEAKDLVNQYREHMKAAPKYNGGGTIEKDDKRSKVSTTAINKARLRAVKKNLKRKTEKHGTVSQAAEKGSRAVKQVMRAEDKVSKIKRLEGRDPSPSKTPKPKAHKTPSSPTRRTSIAPKAKGNPGSQRGAQFAERPKRGDKMKNFFAKCAGNTCAQKQRKAGGSAAFK